MVSLFQKKRENYWVYGIGAAIIEAVYCLFIAVLMNFLSTIFVGPGNVFTFLTLLLIVVFSTAVSGFLIFGYPFYLILRKQYQEAIFTQLLTIVSLVILALVVIIAIIIF